MSSSDSTSLGTTTHVAGTPIEINGRSIQRCVICGEKLLDSASVPLRTDGKPTVIVAYGDGLMVRQLESGKFKPLPYTIMSWNKAHKPLPSDLCLSLVEV